MAVKDENAFSSFELIMCAVLICLSVSIALPNLFKADKVQLKYEAVNLVNNIRYIQSIADVKTVKDAFASTHTVSEPYIIFTNESYTIYYTDINGQKKHIDYIMPESVKIKTYGKKICYFSKDSVTNTMTIALKKGSTMIKVLVDRAGRIRMENKE